MSCRKMNSLLQDRLQAGRADGSVWRNLVNDGHQVGEEVAGTVCQHGGHAGNVHFGLLIVELYEARQDVLPSESRQRVFDDLADLGLVKDLARVHGEMHC